MSTKVEDGYKFAVDCAIECAGDKAAVEFYKGSASALCWWAGAATEEQWKADRQRIAEAQRCAQTTAA